MEDYKPLRIEEIRPLKDVLKDYFIKAFYACGGNKSEVARRLEMNVRTVRDKVVEYGLRLEPIIIPKEEVQKEPEKNDEWEEEETGYRSITPKERDDWYNRDRF